MEASTVIVVGLSHRSAPIGVRERLAVNRKDLPAVLARFRALHGVSETVVLSTCNRMEVYIESDLDRLAERQLKDAIARTLGEMGGRDVLPHLMNASGDDALRHLFRVACSLDSLVVGEPQILGQLKEAIAAASDAGTMGRRLSSAMRSAVQAAKRVRTKTAIGSGQVSVPSVAVDLARHIFEDLSGHTTLVVGAGEMAEAAAKLMARAGAEMMVVNRSAKRAIELASSIGATQLPWEQLDTALVRADIVIASTASRKHIISRKQLKSLRRKRRGRSLFLIDIALPRDIEPSVNDLDNVYLYDIDDLSHVVNESMAGRREQAQRAEAIVREETHNFAQRQQEQAVKPTIVALRSRTREVLEKELNRSCRARLKHLDETDRKALASMLDAAVNKLLHAPTRHLKRMATGGNGLEAASLISQLFELDEHIASAQQRKETSRDRDDNNDGAATEAAEEHPAPMR